MINKILLTSACVIGMAIGANARWEGLDECKFLISEGRYIEANFLYNNYLNSFMEYKKGSLDVNDVEECILGTVFCSYCLESGKSLTLEDFESEMEAYKVKLRRAMEHDCPICH